MNAYKELKERQQKEVNEFPMFFAFSEEQFAEGMKKLGLEPNETDKIAALGFGGYYRKTDEPALTQMFRRHKKELKDAMDDDGFVYDMFYYELSNHEYVVTYDPSDAIVAIGLTEKEVYSDERLSAALMKACRDQLDWYNNQKNS